MEHSGRHAFRRAIRRPDADIDLIEGALAVAQEDLNLADTTWCRDLIQRLAARTAGQVGPPEPTLEYAERLVNYLHRSEGFTGNTSHYDDPSNSYLPLVCERRTGLPLTLSLLLLAVAADNGIPLAPASLPHHFMARWDLPDGTIFLDLFFGQVLDGRACRLFLQAQSGSQLPDPGLFPPVPKRDVLARLLRNLKGSYVRRNNFALALQATERLVLLDPDQSEDLRDRGFLRLRTGDLHRGLWDLDQYIEVEPSAADQPLVRKQAMLVGELVRGRN